MIWIFALAIPLALIGVALIYWSRIFSPKYKAWTAQLRSKSKFLRPPPGPEMAQLNYRIMVTLLRICGALLVAIAVCGVVASLLR